MMPVSNFTSESGAMVDVVTLYKSYPADLLVAWREMMASGVVGTIIQLLVVLRVVEESTITLMVGLVYTGVGGVSTFETYPCLIKIRAPRGLDCWE